MSRPPHDVVLEALNADGSARGTISTRGRPAARTCSPASRSSPASGGKNVMSENKAVDGSVPKQFIPDVENGPRIHVRLRRAAGFPVVDLKMMLIDGAYHEVDTSARAFEIAACAALCQPKAGPVLLEPIIKVEAGRRTATPAPSSTTSTCGAVRSRVRSCAAMPA
jgi:translation elongation factor EF-G